MSVCPSKMGSRLSSIVFQPPEVSYVQAKKHIIWLPILNEKREQPSSQLDSPLHVSIAFVFGNVPNFLETRQLFPHSTWIERLK